MSWFRAKEQNETEHQHRRALLLPQEVARMPADMELVFRDTAPPFLLRRLKWFTDPLFRDLQSSPPPVPTVSYTFARRRVGPDPGTDAESQYPADRTRYAVTTTRKTMRRTIIVTTLVLSLAGCVAPEGGYGGYGTKSVVGGLGGAAAGGLLGSQFGHGGGKLAMTGLGVLAGALAGSAIGQSLDRADQTALEQSTHAALTSQPIGQPIVWNNPQNGNQVVVTPTREGRAGDEYCREYEQTITVGGREKRGYGQACRQPDGSWRIVG